MRRVSTRAWSAWVTSPGRRYPRSSWSGSRRPAAGGFVLLGAWFAVLGLAGPAVARWGERTRPPAPQAGTAAMPEIAVAAETVAGQAAVID